MRNGTIPIGTLPPEIMSTIFQMDLEATLPRNDKRRLGTVSLVCRRWNRMVLETPSLWSHWDQSDGLAHFKRARDLSKAAGLEISCDLSEETLWGLVRSERERWEDVNFRLATAPTSSLDAFQDLGMETAPKLRKLGITVSPPCPPPTPLDMFTLEDPCPLEELRLSRVPINWAAVNLSNLRVLEISNLLHFGPSVHQILEILTRSTQLQRLALAGVAMSQDSVPHPPSSPIVLPFLSVLELRCGNVEASDIILGISVPSCQELQVSGVNWRRLSLHDSQPILDVIGNIIQLGETKVWLRENSVYLQKLDHTLRVRFDAEPQHAYRWLATVAGPVLNRSPSITLVCETDFEHEALMDIVVQSSQLRNITALQSVRGFGGPVRCNVLECLATLGNQIHDIFPQLQEITAVVSTVSEVESLRTVVVRCRPGGDAEGLQLRAVHVHLYDKDVLLPKCKALFQEIYASLLGGELWVSSERWHGV